MRLVLVVGFLVAFGGGAKAQSAFCANGSFAASLVPDAQVDQGAAILSDKCKPGDIVLIPVSKFSLIATSCDFSKSINQVGIEILCVLTTRRPMRP